MLQTQDMLNVSLHSNKSDIESQNLTNSVNESESLTKIKEQVDNLVGILKNTRENDRHTEEAINFCLSTFAILLILLISIPLVIGDLYYAFTDHSCLNHSTVPVINLFIYLLLSGIYTGIEVIMDIVIIYFKIYKSYDISKLFTHIKLFTTIFGFIWTFIGAIMFWKSFEYRISCNNGIYKYVFAQIIIKFVLTVINFKRIINKR